MIQFLNEYGVILVVIELMAIQLVILHQETKSPLTKLENQAIMDSVEHRKNSFLMNRTVSRWGED